MVAIIEDLQREKDAGTCYDWSPDILLIRL
jgi:hypothetical protein